MSSVANVTVTSARRPGLRRHEALEHQVAGDRCPYPPRQYPADLAGVQPFETAFSSIQALAVSHAAPLTGSSVAMVTISLRA